MPSPRQPALFGSPTRPAMALATAEAVAKAAMRGWSLIQQLAQPARSAGSTGCAKTEKDQRGL